MSHVLRVATILPVPGFSGVETVGAFVGNATAATDDANVHFKVAAEEVGLLSNNENKQEDSNASLSLVSSRISILIFQTVYCCHNH